MNLHGMAAGAIGIVNPFVTAQLYPSTGFATQPDGRVAPSYGGPVQRRVQAQALTSRDLQHVDQLNLQGVMKKFWLDGALLGVVRKDGRGGDLIVLDGVAWLVTAVMEVWPDWCSVIATQQTAVPDDLPGADP